MLLAFTFILLAIGVGILVSVYSIFFPFIKNLGEVGNFNTAYYGAVSSIERAELSIKYHSPGFQGGGGYTGTNRGPISDAKTGSNFGFLNNGNNGMRWTVTSRTKQIPNTGQGDVEYLLAATDSKNYNMLDYRYAEKLILSIDSTSNAEAYYTGTNQTIAYFSGGYFDGIIRLPPKILSGFGGAGQGSLCTSATDPICNTNGDGMGDDILVDRSLEGVKNGTYFKIIPNLSVLYYSGRQVDKTQDIAIRKEIINLTGKLYFGNTDNRKRFSPIDSTNQGYNTDTLSGHIVISSDPTAIEDTYFGQAIGTTILGGTPFTGLEVNFGLVTLLTTTNHNVYPFLEYQFRFPQYIADSNYTIQGNGRVGEYDVKIQVQKPTSEGSVAGSFTVIF